MKLSYFDQDAPDEDDILLGMAKKQECVPNGCLLGGIVVMNLIQSGANPCDGCLCPREKCGGNAPVDQFSAKPGLQQTPRRMGY